MVATLKRPRRSDGGPRRVFRNASRLHPGIEPASSYVCFNGGLRRAIDHEPRTLSVRGIRKFGRMAVDRSQSPALSKQSCQLSCRRRLIATVAESETYHPA
jgi:hypothetical protein